MLAKMPGFTSGCLLSLAVFGPPYTLNPSIRVGLSGQGLSRSMLHTSNDSNNNNNSNSSSNDNSYNSNANCNNSSHSNSNDDQSS